jgi:phage terminase large subunit
MHLTPSISRRALIELAKLARARRYQHFPEQWYVERFGGKLTDVKWSAWGGPYDNHQWDGTPDPFMVAIDALRRGMDVGIEAATGVSKTYMAARIAYWFLDCFPESAVITSAPTRAQLLQVLWKEISIAYSSFKRIRSESTILTGEVRVNKNIQYEDDSNQIVYSNRMISRVGRKRAGEDSSVSFQGIHNKYQLFILDEAAGLETSVMTAIKNTNTDKSDGSLNLILALGNPDSVTDALHVFCQSPGVQGIRISAYDHPNIVFKRKIINGAVTKESIAIRTQEYGEESNLYKSRVRGIAPEQASDALIMMKWVLQCAKFHPSYNGTKAAPLEDIPNDVWSHNAVGVDVANSLNGDAACLAWGKGNELQELHEFQCPNATHLAENLVMSAETLLILKRDNYNTSKLSTYQVAGDRVGIDAVGIGVATVNKMVELGYSVQSLQGGSDDTAIPKDAEEKPLYKFRSLRAQMWFQARLDLQNRDCRIALTNSRILTELVRQLTTVKYTVSDGYIVIEKKKDIKERLGGKSPNLADAFVYWNWVRKRRSGQYKGEMPISGGYESTQSQSIEPDQRDEFGIWKPESDEMDGGYE